MPAKIAAALALILLVPIPVRAVDPPQRFQDGIRALQAGRAEDALRDFEAAYAGDPSRSLLFYIGEAHFALDHRAMAEEYYRKYLVEFPGGPKVPEAKERLAELRARQAESLSRYPAPPRATAPAPALPPLTVPLVPPRAPAPAPAASAPAPAAAPEPVTVARAPAPPVALPPAPSPGVPQFGAPRTPALATTGPAPMYFVAYAARLVVVPGSAMGRYATYRVGSGTALYTHGFALGRQDQTFKNAVYAGFGSEWGGGSDTLQRYELSWQFAWAPLGTESLFNPHAGFRLGGMMVASDKLTGASLKPGVILAPQLGVDLQIIRWVVITGSFSYDLNLGPDMGPDASISGYAFNLGAAVRF